MAWLRIGANRSGSWINHGQKGK